LISDYNVYILNKKEILYFCFTSGPASAAVIYLFYNSLVLSIAASILPLAMKNVYSHRMAKKRKAELVDQFKDFLYSISASISAGRPMRTSLKEAESSMRITYGHKSLIATELTAMVIKMEGSGETEETVLKDFANRSGVKDIMSFADIYGISKVTGADMQKVINKTVQILLYRIELDREVKVMVSQKRFEFVILAFMPPAIMLFLRISSPSYLCIMYETIPGRLLMSASLIFMVSAIALAHRITVIEL
jgi:tight adherence protein B